ncbi:MAG TPA: hypothetical protein PK880_08800 [Candidatus Competibacter sp.]|nr:hypothetical protein [Candidatus Competibacter sp.]
MKPAIQYRNFQLVGDPDLHGDVRVGILRREALDGGRNRRQRIAGGIVDDTEVELAARTVSKNVRRHAELVDGLEQLLQGGMVRRAGFGQPKTAAAALAEFGAEPDFQLAHILADHRLADVQHRLSG